MGAEEAVGYREIRSIEKKFRDQNKVKQLWHYTFLATGSENARISTVFGARIHETELATRRASARCHDEFLHYDMHANMQTLEFQECLLEK